MSVAGGVLEIAAIVRGVFAARRAARAAKTTVKVVDETRAERKRLLDAGLITENQADDWVKEERAKRGVEDDGTIWDHVTFASS
jgi:hypothetical protein